MERQQNRGSDDQDYNSDEISNFSKSSSSTSQPASEAKVVSNEAIIEYCLPYVQAGIFASILEDTILQLRLLDNCNNELRISKTMADMAIHLAGKYQIKQPPRKDDLDGIDVTNLGCIEYKLDKLVADRKYCTDILEKTYLDLSLNRCYSALSENNKRVVETDLYRADLIEEEGKNRLLRRELAKQLRQQRNHNRTVAYDTDLQIDLLKSKVEDATLNSETRSRYISNWEGARSEQHAQTIQDAEAGPSESIAYYQKRTDQEQRAHSEVELLVNIFINDILEKVDSWMNKYDTDMEALDLKIAIMKNKYQDAVSKKKLLTDTYAEHEILMKKWVEFKEERMKARLYRDKMHQSAITVQAWWRGLLVRLELGPYKPNKKPPSKAAGKKK